MKVPLRWLREYVDVDLTPEQLAERLTLLGMEVKGIVRWGDDWRNVVVGELLSVERHPRADRLSLTRVTIGDGEPLEIVCGATNIAAGQRVPVALPGAVLPGDRRIERTEKMGVVSNGMLCSGDELGLTADADGILILPADTPLGTAARRAVRRRRPRRRRQAEPRRRAVDRRPGARGRGGDRRDAPAARRPTSPSRAARPPNALRSRSAIPTCARASSAAGSSGVHVGPSPDRIQMRLLAAGQRPISNVVDASNYVMVELGKPIHTFDAAAVHDGRIIVRRARPGRALRDARPRRARARPRDPAHRRPGAVRSASPASWAAPTSEIGEGDDRRHRRVGHLRPDQHPPDGLPLRPAVRGEPALREGPGVPPGADRRRPDGPAHRRVGRRRGRARRGRLRTRSSRRRRRVAFRPARVNRLLGHGRSRRDEQRALLARVGIETAPAAPATRIRVAAGTTAARRRARATTRSSIATVPTWRRDLAIEADITEEIVRVRGYELVPATLPAHADAALPATTRWRCATLVRDTLAGAGLTEVVTLRPGRPEARSSASRPHDDGDARRASRSSAPAGRPVTVTNPLSSQHSVLRQSLIGSLLEVVVDEPAVMAATTSRSSRSARATARRTTPPTHEWWRLGLRADRRGRAAGLGPAGPAVRPRRREGRPRAALPPARLPGAGLRAARRRPEPPPRPGRARRRPAAGSSAGSASCIPASIAALDLRAERIVVAELAIAGLAGGQPAATA